MASYPEYLSDEQCQHLDANGVPGVDARTFSQAGITDPAQMIYLTAKGVPSVNASWFSQAGVTDPKQILHLTAHGVGGWDARSFAQAGVTGLEQMINLAANGVTGEDARWFAVAGITDHAQMIWLAKLTPYPAVPYPAVLTQIPAARKRAGDEIVDRVLSAGARIGRFPHGTLTGLTRSIKIAAELKELSDEALDVTFTLVEDEFDATGGISVARIRETLNIIH